MSKATVTTTARKPLILRGDSVEVTLCAVDVYHVSGRAGATTGYAVGGVYRKGAPGKSGEARSQLHALERILVILGVDAIARTELDRYRRVYNTAAKAARACEAFAAAYDCALGDNAARIIAAEAKAEAEEKTDKIVGGGARKTPAANDIISDAVAKARKRSNGSVALALLSAVSVSDIPDDALSVALQRANDITAAISAAIDAKAEAEAAKAEAEAEETAREIAKAEAALEAAKAKAAKAKAAKAA